MPVERFMFKNHTPQGAMLGILTSFGTLDLILRAGIRIQIRVPENCDSMNAYRTTFESHIARRRETHATLSTLAAQARTP